mmetsp:Transcript_25258/g.35424  ORF Transcript_25258/g.35424 Transcript_25258/m.35424 type:complete len:244 (+) Transcript_25258:6771-7502(+)
MGVKASRASRVSLSDDANSSVARECSLTWAMRASSRASPAVVSYVSTVCTEDKIAVDGKSHEVAGCVIHAAKALAAEVVSFLPIIANKGDDFSPSASFAKSLVYKAIVRGRICPAVEFEVIASIIDFPYINEVFDSFADPAESTFCTGACNLRDPDAKARTRHKYAATNPSTRGIELVALYFFTEASITDMRPFPKAVSFQRSNTIDSSISSLTVTTKAPRDRTQSAALFLIAGARSRVRAAS